MLDSSDIFYPSGQRALSDMQPLLDEMLPHLPHAVLESFRKPKDSDLLKEKRMNFNSKISSSDRGSPAVDKTDALKDVFMWGGGIGRFLGDGHDTLENADSRSDTLVPRLLQSTRMLEVTSICCGEKHAALVTKQGEVFCWGEERGGRLRHKININVPRPKVIESLNGINVQTVSCGSHHTCAVSNAGELYSWGDSDHGIKEYDHRSRRNQWFPQRVLGPLAYMYQGLPVESGIRLLFPLVDSYSPMVMEHLEFLGMVVGAGACQEHTP